ncbi:MAG: hypothetical protein R3359_13155, partial [Marinirhabdus sp.]|nr:hypothetical protein [Marinirhabdus sp.]
MKFLVSIIVLFMLPLAALAQPDKNTPNSVKIEATDITTEAPDGITLPASPKPSLTPRDTPSKYANLGKENPEEFDMTKGDGLKTYNAGST